jgi:hypothetical protein
MEIKIPSEKAPYPGEDRPRKALRLESLRSVTLRPPPVLVPRAEADKKTQTRALSLTAELLSLFDRELKYEVQEDAGVVQIQVIDTNDGGVVRKIPADEVIKIIEAIKEKLDERVDVLA